MAKRRKVDDQTCLFCREVETVTHLFYECCIARHLWETISEVMGVQIGPDFESMAKFWPRDKKFAQLNSCTTFILWTI
jgi:hypothetical protein